MKKIGLSKQVQVSRSEAVREALREAILSGLLMPGERLNLDEIAEEFGVSRMPVRDAVRQLESEGLVKVFPYKGVEVSSLSSEEIEELFTLRSALEQVAVERAVTRLSKDTLAEMRHILEQIDALESRSAQWFELNARFHRYLNEACGWPRLLEMIDTLRSNADRYVRSYISNAGMEVPQQQHWALLRACEAGDIAAAREVIDAHLMDTAASLIETLREREGDNA
ncbi:GntR family transcriptional regulator [Alcanivorax sp. ZXX171]|nr:GntR family transcriptional regulator [Alcanivorax sp. ZXX171]